MIPDFTNLLTAIVSGDGAGALGTVGKKMQRKTPGLMPSQSILTDIGEGMKHAADRNTAAPMPEHTQTVQAKTPWQSTNVGKGGMGVLGNVSNTLNDMVNQPMSAPQQIDDGSYAQQVVAKYLPKYAQGGIIPAGQRGLVGDRGKHKEAQEIVDVLPDGSGAVVTPVGHYVGGLDQPAVEQNGLEQTVQGNPLTTILQNRTLEPTDTLTTVDINDNNPVLQADEIAANAKRDEIAQASVVGQNKWKDIGYGILQGVANAVAGTNKPIQTYGEVKRDRRVRQLAPQLQMLEDKVKTRQEGEKVAFEKKYRQAQVDELNRRPEEEEKKRQGRLNAQRERINLNANIRAGIAKPFVDEKGKVWLQFLNADANGKIRPNEPLIGADGQQEYVPGEQGVEWLNPRTKQTELIKARQGASADATIANAEAQRAQQQAQFERRQQLDEKQFGLAKAKYEQGVKEYNDALSRGDADRARKAKETLIGMMQKAAEAKTKGELDEGQYNILTDLTVKVLK